MSGGTASMDEGKTPLPGNIRQVLQAVKWEGGRANTADIISHIGAINSNIASHAQRCVDHGLLERVDKEDLGAPFPANVYRLTDKGDQYV